ncbi:MAG: sulfur carrier protein ThiS [Dehalococcoidia bacterium]|nr:thiamine biosynthesis protein ThiS [Chloroflexota bacterium]MCH2524927.1 sulfur carrier protein ThiS [Dehalococcoidia bacterium]MQG00258.1 sulfur carrier protein ThiS [SAR202 cluster bacterium]
MISLKVNGKIQEIQEGKTIYELIIGYGLTTKYLAVAHNGEIIDSNQFNTITLSDGDNLEIVQPVGGG